MSDRNIITIEPGERRQAMYSTDANHCLRCSQLLAAGMSHAEISDDFPKLTEDIRACLELAADRRYCFQVGEQFKDF